MTGEQDIKMRYLFGRASSRERLQFEEQYLTNLLLFEELIAAEDEMIRRYLRADFTERDNGDFEIRYLSTEHGREKVAFEQSLMEYLTFGKSP